jgi:hypothetical protein
MATQSAQPGCASSTMGADSTSPHQRALIVLTIAPPRARVFPAACTVILPARYRTVTSGGNGSKVLIGSRGPGDRLKSARTGHWYPEPRLLKSGARPEGESGSPLGNERREDVHPIESARRLRGKGMAWNRRSLLVGAGIGASVSALASSAFSAAARNEVLDAPAELQPLIVQERKRILA